MSDVIYRGLCKDTGRRVQGYYVKIHDGEESHPAILEVGPSGSVPIKDLKNRLLSTPVLIYPESLSMKIGGYWTGDLFTVYLSGTPYKSVLTYSVEGGALLEVMNSKDVVVNRYKLNDPLIRVRPYLGG